MAAQLIATNLLSARGLSRCNARASSSLPVPDSPSSNVVALVGATFSIMRHTLSMPSLAATMPSSGDSLARLCRRRFSLSSSEMLNARSTSKRSVSVSTGFW